MATPSIRSVSTAAADATNAVTVTKPAGTASGDLLIGIVFTYDGAAGVIPSDETGFTNIVSGSLSFQAAKSYYKVAGGSEPANYTFDISSSVDTIRAIMFAITGFSSGAPIGDSVLVTSNTSTTTPSFSTTFKPRRSDALLIMGIISDASTTSITASDYIISGTNPTWTEQYENTEGSDHVLGVATATANSAADVTSFGYTLSSNGSDHVGILISIPETASETATPDSVAVRAIIPTQDSAAAVKMTPDSVAIKTAIPTQSSTYPTTIWSNQSKNGSTWTPQNKP